MRQNMMWHVPPAVWTVRGPAPGWVTVLPVEFVIPFPQTEDVFHYLRFCLQMNVYLTVNTVLTAPLMMWSGLHLLPLRSVSLPWNFIGETISKGYF